MREHVIAVDIGTGSARAGLFDLRGGLLARAEHPILMHRPHENHAEHQSENIWFAVSNAVRAVRQMTGLAASAIGAIGFDATCSLVVRDQNGLPLPVTAGGAHGNDTIVWMDHRAMEEAFECDQIAHPALASNNGHMSPEMQIPKLMWLKKHLGPRWQDVGYLFDLADFLTWKATGNAARSLCTLTAKWNYLDREPEGWSADLLEKVDLSDILVRGNLPTTGVAVGQKIGTLSAAAARDLDLDETCVVGPGLIDAYAGVLGSLGAHLGNLSALEQQFALVGGTSSCVVALSAEQKSGSGLWGPYYQPLLPDVWLTEGGQSASGALLDYVVRMHVSGGEPDAARHQAIIDRIETLRGLDGPDFAAGLHVLPDFHGNRSPWGDPRSAGVVSGLSLDMSFDGLCKLYFRTALAIAFSMRQVLSRLVDNGYQGKVLHVAGGHTHNRLLMELYGDVCGYGIVLPPDGSDVVLLGTAMAAAVSSGHFPHLAAAGQAMALTGTMRKPDANKKVAFDRDFRIFERMQAHRREIETL